MAKAFKAISKLVGKILPSGKLPKLGLAGMMMPDPGSTGAKLAARKKIEARGTKGREGTIYSGGAYGGANLGGTA
jgi:hypothetical protein